MIDLVSTLLSSANSFIDSSLIMVVYRQKRSESGSLTCHTLKSSLNTVFGLGRGTLNLADRHSQNKVFGFLDMLQTMLLHPAKTERHDYPIGAI